MEMYLARQAIFSSQKRLQAYELLYRGAGHYSLGQISGNRATTSLLTTAFLTEGIEKVSNSKPCFINFTAELLLKKVPLSFPKNQVVIEVLEDVPPTPAIVDVCHTFVKQGYRLALDDFVYHPSFEPLLQLAHYVKIDFTLTKGAELEKMIFRLARHDLQLLAEKVETYAEFEQALKLGFSLFQGYFFGRPEMLKSKEVPASQLNLLQLLAEVNKKSTTVKQLQDIFSRDVGMAYKLLRFINSAYFFLEKNIESVSHAIVYLGEKGMKRFVVLLIISEIATSKPPELLRLSVVRARFCELLAEESQLWDDSGEIFLLGLFSMLDALLDTAMDQVMARLPLAGEIKEALISGSGTLYPFLEAVSSYERAEEQQCLSSLQKLAVKPGHVYGYYREAVAYADKMVR